MKLIKWFALTAILAFFVGLWVYDRCLTSDNIITLYDTTRIEIPVEVNVPFEVIEYEYITSTDTIYLVDSILLTPVIDSALILADYVRTRRYKDTVADSDMVAYIDESIQFNRLKSRDFSYQILRPTTIIQPNPIKIYIGATATLDGIAPNVSYFRDNWGASVGYDPFNKNLVLGFNYKLISY